MRKPALALCALVLASMPAGAADRSRREAPDAKGEAQLARLLEGRVAGKPVDCIILPQVNETEVIAHTAIVYRLGGTLYVNRPEGGLSSLRRDDILVTNLSLSQLCNVDVVQLLDQGSRTQRGFVNLGMFVPYTRVEAKAR